MVKTSDEIGPGSKIEAIGSATRTKELQSHIAKGEDRGKGRPVLIFSVYQAASHFYTMEKSAKDKT